MPSQNPIFEDQFYGMDRRSDSDKLADGYSPLAVNVDLDRLGTVRKRRGTTLLGGAGTKDAKVQNIIQYVNQAGKTEIHMIRAGAMYRYNPTNLVWDLLKGAQFPSGLQVQSVNYKNRIYHTSINESLRWNAGDNVVTLVSPGSKPDQISGGCVAVGQRTLFIGNVTFNGVTYPDRVYYSLFDTAGNTEGDKFWNEEETGLQDSTRWFRIEGGVVQAIVSYASRNRVYIFSDTKCYVFDVNQVETNPFGALVEIFPMGCAGPRAATVVDGLMYFMDKQGKIWVWDGATSRPQEMSFIIDDSNLGDSVISQIDKAADNMSKICAFGLGKRVYFSVGTLAIDNQVLPNACIKLSASQNGLRAHFSIDTFPDRVIVANSVNITDSQSVAIGDSTNVLLLDTDLNDTNNNAQPVAINSYYRTKSYHFGMPFQKKTIRTMLVKYRPQAMEKSYLEIGVAVEGSPEYQPITNPDTIAPRFGAIDMYHARHIMLRQATAKLNLPIEAKGLTISFEYSNRQLNQSFEISSFGFDGVSIDPPNIPIV